MTTELRTHAGNIIKENSEIGTVVGFLSVDDDDVDNSDIKIQVSDSSPFEVTDANELVVGGKVNFEVANQWRVNISVRDDGHPSHHVSIKILLTLCELSLHHSFQSFLVFRK